MSDKKRPPTVKWRCHYGWLGRLRCAEGKPELFAKLIAGKAIPRCPERKRLNPRNNKAF